MIGFRSIDVCDPWQDKKMHQALKLLLSMTAAEKWLLN